MPYHDQTVAAVWEKARIIQGRDPTQWRMDQCGAWIRRDNYRQGGSEYGWKIENVSPGGPDLLDNLQAFHMNNTYDVANGKPSCRVMADREDVAAGQRMGSPRNSGAL